MIKELEQKITEAATAYYTGQSIMSDSEFDSLIEQLRDVDPDNKLLSTPGWGYVPTLNKAIHDFGNVGSLSKYRDCVSLNYALEQAAYNRIIMPKYDGISNVAYYRNGKIYKSVTRGNGVEGTSVIDKFLYITKVGSIPVFDNDEEIAIRGEFIISDSNFAKMREEYPQYKNSRNAVAGIINSKEMSDCLKYIDFVPYKIQGSKLLANKEVSLCELLDFLSTYFPHTTRYIKVHQGNQITQETLERAYNLRGDYPCDGTVASYDFEEFLEDGTANVTQYAYKFEDEKAESRVDHLEWKLTRTGKMAPVAVIDPVELDGATIKRVTCFNAQYVKENRIGPEAYVEIQRSGMVIPDIQRVTVECPEFELPTVCPHCGHELKWSGVDLICDNPDCESANYSRLYNWISWTSAVKGVSKAGINDFIDILGVDSIEDIYIKLNKDSAKLLIDSAAIGTVTRKKYMEMVDWLYGPIDPKYYFCGLNIKRIGWNTAKVLSEAGVHILIKNFSFQSSKEHDELVDKIYSLPNCGSSMVDAIRDNLPLMSKVANLIKFAEAEPTKVETPEITHTYCVTGSLNFGSRSQFLDFTRSKGWDLTDIKNAEYLVTNNPDPTSSKGRKAKELGIKIITEEEFVEMIEKENN